mmetsp:Transcript_12191/g.39238  ORF Transcript_12191/g.39238 Transcript_12191/m.39238 type:complete len:85 (+) Transcript_12191:117-371(+)
MGYQRYRKGGAQGADMDHSRYMNGGVQAGDIQIAAAAGDGKDASAKKVEHSIDASHSQGSAAGSDYKQYMDYSKYMRGGAQYTP